MSKSLVEPPRLSPEARRGPGRPPKSGEAMKGAERSMRRMARLAGIELAAEDAIEHLWRLHRELDEAKLPEWSERIGKILTRYALKLAAEYARRNSAYFVVSEPTSLTLQEKEVRQRSVLKLAGEIDVLADSVFKRKVGYADFERILGSLRVLGFWIDARLTSAVARSFALA